MEFKTFVVMYFFLCNAVALIVISMLKYFVKGCGRTKVNKILPRKSAEHVPKYTMKITTQLPVIYKNPPIDEIVCGMRFDPIKQLQSGHFGILWQKFMPDFPKTEDQNLVGPVSGKDLGNSDKLPLPRVWFIHENENELIQVQRNRFLHNWRKRRPEDEYPGYKKIVENFERYLACFQEFLVEENLGNLVAKEYELTYIDLIPQGQGWEKLSDLGKVFPNLLSTTKQELLSTDIRVVNWQTILDLPDKMGQLGLAIRSANRISNAQQIIHIEFSALSHRPYQPMQAWYETAHNTIIQLFSNLVSTEIQEEFWGRTL